MIGMVYHSQVFTEMALRNIQDFLVFLIFSLGSCSKICDVINRKPAKPLHLCMLNLVGVSFCINSISLAYPSSFCLLTQASSNVTGFFFLWRGW